jgi:NAD(P)-dependent dehydrogenase (short-subunit alcohol dehydrogenase family)
MSSVGFNPFGRVAVITGGARGLGFEFARRLVSEGAKVCISDIDVGVGEEAAEEIRKLYGVGKDR